MIPDLISVVMPAYNHSSFVDAAIASVRSQTYEHLELIAVDDGSTDNTYERLVAATEGDPRLRVLRHPDGRNHGRVATLRRAIGVTSGTYLAFLASDDRWLADKLSIQAGHLRRGAEFVYGRARRIDRHGHDLDPPFGHAPFPDRGALESLLSVNFIPASTVVVTRKRYEEVGGFDDDQVYEDLDLWLRFCAWGEPAFVDDFLAEYRVLDTGADQTILRAGAELPAYGAAVNHLAAWAGLPDHHRSTVERWARCWTALVRLLKEDGTGVVGVDKEDAVAFVELLGFRLDSVVGLIGAARLRRTLRESTELSEALRRQPQVANYPWSLAMRSELRRALRRRDARAAVTTVRALIAERLADSRVIAKP